MMNNQNDHGMVHLTVPSTNKNPKRKTHHELPEESQTIDDDDISGISDLSDLSDYSETMNKKEKYKKRYAKDIQKKKLKKDAK